MAAIVLDQGNDNYKLRCSGSIISSWHIISASHCFDNQNDNQHLKVFIGSVDPELHYESGRIIKDIDTITNHDNFFMSFQALNSLQSHRFTEISGGWF